MKRINYSKIKQIAKDKGITMKYLADNIGCDKSYFTTMSARERNIPDDKLVIIAKLLDTTVEYLRDETDDPTTIERKFLSDNLSEETTKLLETVNKLPEEDRRKLVEYAELLEKKLKE